MEHTYKPRSRDMEWSAEIAMLDMWRGMDKNVSNGVMQRYFKEHLQAAYDRGRQDVRRERYNETDALHLPTVDEIETANDGSGFAPISDTHETP